MERVGLLSLPVEVILLISRHLSLDDVLSCSLTCRYLRHSLNDNTLWKRLLPDQDITMLELSGQSVKPYFQLPHTITPPCENKIHFMRKIHLLNNWKTGNYVEHSTKRKHSHAYRFNPSRGNLHYKDRYIFVTRFTRNHDHDAIELWDIANVPVLYTKIHIKNLRFTEFLLMGDNLVVIESYKVTVYQINILQRRFSILFSFVIVEGATNGFFTATSRLPVDDSGDNYIMHEERCQTWKHYTIGHCLVSYTRPNCSFHIWDISDGSKVGSFSSPIDCNYIDVHSDVTNELCLVQMRTDNSSYFMQFDIENKTFSPPVFELMGKAFHIIYFGSYIILFQSNNENALQHSSKDLMCTVFDFKSNQRLQEKRFSNLRPCFIYDMGFTTVLNGMLVIPCKNHFEIVKALTLETMKCVYFDSDIRSIAYYFDVLGSVFVVTSNRFDMLELWDLQNYRIIPLELDMLDIHQVQLDKLCSKLVYFDHKKITVKHFW